jgi:hypothetical protein
MKKPPTKRDLQRQMFESKLPEYLDLVVAEDPRNQEEGEFIHAFVKGLNENLKGAGLGCFFMGPNVTNQGYRIGLADAERRRYYTGFTFDEAIFMAEKSAGSPFQELLTLICERALVTREVEFEKRRANDVLTLGEIVQEHVPS